MKNLLLQLLICFSLSVCLISCDKDDDDNGSSGNDSFSTKIDGTDFSRSGTDAYALDNDDNFQILGATLGIGGGTQSTETMYFIFEDANGAVSVEEGKTYTFDESTLETLVAFYVTADGTSYTSFMGTESEGTIKITKFDDSTVAGTFSMTLFNDTGGKVDITDGAFDVDWKVF